MVLNSVSLLDLMRQVHNSLCAVAILVTSIWGGIRDVATNIKFCLAQVKVYEDSGYLWENYDETDGHGKGSHPFTGWTALLVLVAGQTY